MSRRIRVGSTSYVVPDDATDDEITQIVDGHGAGAAPPPMPTPQVKMETSTLGRLAPVGEAISNLTQGIGEGAFSTAANVGKLITDPIVKHIATPDQMQRSDQFIKRVTTPDNTTQKVGKFAEQTGELLTPTGLEGAVAGHLPQAAKIIKPAAKIATQAVETGLKNKAQGGDFTTGAAAGAGGELLGMGAQKIAPMIAESALGITGKMRGHGRTIGNAILDETSGVAPETIGKQAGQRIGALTGQLENKASAFSVANSASTNPAHAVIDNAISKAPRNATDYIDKLESLKPMLDFNKGIGPQRRAFTPEEILEMKRGVDKQISSWSPEIRKGVEGVKRQIYRALDDELDRTVPGAQGLNQRISSLIPAQRRANVIANNASTTQRIAHRVAAHTGALAGAGTGAVLGYERGGTPGALAGGAAGLVLPEMIASPTGLMTTARFLKSSPPVVRGLRSGLLQLNRGGTK